MMGALIDAAPGQLTVRVTRSGFFAIDGAGSCFLNWLQGVGGGPAGRQAGWGGGQASVLSDCVELAPDFCSHCSFRQHFGLWVASRLHGRTLWPTVQ